MSSLRLALKASLEQPNSAEEPGKHPKDKEKKPRKERPVQEGTTPVTHVKSAAKPLRGPSSPVSASKPHSQLARKPPKHPGSAHGRSPQKDHKADHSLVSDKPKRDLFGEDASKDGEHPAPGKKRRRTESELSEKHGGGVTTPRGESSKPTQSVRPKHSAAPVTPSAATKPTTEAAQPTAAALLQVHDNQQQLMAQAAESTASPTKAKVEKDKDKYKDKDPQASETPVSPPGNSKSEARTGAPPALRIAIPGDQSDDTESLSPTSQFRSEQDDHHDMQLSVSEADDRVAMLSDKEDGDGEPSSRGDTLPGEGDGDDENDDTETDEEVSRSTSSAARRKQKLEPRTPSARNKEPLPSSRSSKSESGAVRRQKRPLEEGTPKPRSARNAAMVANSKLTVKTPKGGADTPASEPRRARPEESKRHSMVAAATAAVKEENWVQCDKCAKWRRIPGSVDMDSLPDSWYCSMNQWDAVRQSCSASEENYQDTVVRATSTPSLEMDDEEEGRTTRGRPSMRGQKKKRIGRGRDSDDEVDSLYEQRTRDTKRRSVQPGRNSMDASAAPPGAATGAGPTVVEKVDWVQCNKCRKWRKVPSAVDVSQFTSDWYCSMNTWAPRMASCDVPEEDEEPQLVALPLRSQRNRRPRQDTIDGLPQKEVRHWVQCERRGCKKWRRLPLGMTPEELPDKWYCEMNTWDPEVADCDAPEELETREDAAGLGPSVISLRAKNAGTLSYRKLIFGPDGRVRPIFSDRNRNNFGLFSFVETHRQSGSDEYIEPTRRIGYWWASCYDNSSAVANAGAPVPTTRTPRGGRKRGRRGNRGPRASKPKQEEESEDDEDDEETKEDGQENDGDTQDKSVKDAQEGAVKAENAKDDPTATKMEVVVKNEAQTAAGPERDVSDSTTHTTMDSTTGEAAPGANDCKSTVVKADSATKVEKADKKNAAQAENTNAQDEAVSFIPEASGRRAFSGDLAHIAQRRAGWNMAPATRAEKYSAMQASIPLLQRRHIERGIVHTLINVAGCSGKPEAEILADLERITFPKPEVEACKKMLTISSIRSYVRELELDGLVEVLFNNAGSLVFKMLKAPVCDELGFDKGRFPEQCRGPLKLRKPWTAPHTQQQG